MEGDGAPGGFPCVKSEQGIGILDGSPHGLSSLPLPLPTVSPGETAESRAWSQQSPIADAERYIQHHLHRVQVR